MSDQVQHTPQVQGVWRPSADPQQPTCITGLPDHVLAQLAWIDRRISRSLPHAATSNRARGAVREWTQKKQALLRAVHKQPRQGSGG